MSEMIDKTVCTGLDREPVQNDGGVINKETKWKQYIAGVTASMSMVSTGAWFCWPTPLLPHLLGDNSPMHLTPAQASWMVSCVEIGSLMAPFPASFFADNFGRKICILLIAPLSFISFMLIICLKDALSLCAARLVQGLAISIGFAITPIYLGEIASPENRGKITGLFSISWSLGCLFPYCVGPFLTYDEFTYITFLLTVMFVLSFSWQPESPYFNTMKGNEKKTVEMLNALRDFPTDISIQKELSAIKLEVSKQIEEKGSWKDLWATPEDRRGLLIIISIGVVLQISGQNAILTYMTDIFFLLPRNFIPPDLMTIFVGIAALAGSIFSVFVSDRFGRRFLLLVSSISCFLSLFTAAVYFYLYKHTKINISAVSWIAPVAIISYILFLTAGINSVICSYSSELFPTKTRASASGVSNINLAICSLIVLKSYDCVSSIIGIDFLFLFYSMICAFGTVIFYFVMPETRGKTFLEVRGLLIKSVEK